MLTEYVAVQSAMGKQESMLEGFTAISHIQMYWNVCEDTYLRGLQGPHQQSIFNALVTLYSHVVEYQALAICHLSRAQLKRAWQSVIGWNDWSEKASTVEKLSKRYSELIPPIQEEALQDNWNHQLQEMQQSRTILDTIRMAVEGGAKLLLSIYDDQKETSLFHDLASDYEDYKDFNRLRVRDTCEWFFQDETFRNGGIARRQFFSGYPLGPVAASRFWRDPSSTNGACLPTSQPPLCATFSSGPESSTA